MQVFLQTLGCRLNEAEVESWTQSFRSQGIKLAPSISKADFIVLNTCAVTKESVKKSRNMIRKAQRDNPAAKIVVSGCYATLNSKEVFDEFGVDLVINNSEKDRLVEISKKILPKAIESPDTDEAPTDVGVHDSHHRSFVKVQDGCRYRCTYCIVTIARGNEVSRPIIEIVNQINRLHSMGKKEVVLTGVHLGGYGSDIKSSLTELIDQILEKTKIPRIRLGSLEPWDIPSNFWVLFQNKRLLPHLHLPLQSGSDTVLRRMSRRCKTRDYATLINTAKERVKDFSVTTDIIVGFPGETEKEWQETIKFVDKMCFAHAHIFTFSPHDGTKAASLQLPVSRSIKRERSKELHQVIALHKAKNLDMFKNRRFKVLFESAKSIDINGQKIWNGYTPNYLKVNLPLDPLISIENQILSVKTISVSKDGEKLIAKI